MAIDVTDLGEAATGAARSTKRGDFEAKDSPSLLKAIEEAKAVSEASIWRLVEKEAGTLLRGGHDKEKFEEFIEAYKQDMKDGSPGAATEALVDAINEHMEAAKDVRHSVMPVVEHTMKPLANMLEATIERQAEGTANLNDDTRVAGNADKARDALAHAAREVNVALSEAEGHIQALQREMAGMSDIVPSVKDAISELSDQLSFIQGIKSQLQSAVTLGNASALIEIKNKIAGVKSGIDSAADTARTEMSVANAELKTDAYQSVAKYEMQQLNHFSAAQNRELNNIAGLPNGFGSEFFLGEKLGFEEEKKFREQVRDQMVQIDKSANAHDAARNDFLGDKSDEDKALFDTTQIAKDGAALDALKKAPAAKSVTSAAVVAARRESPASQTIAQDNASATPEESTAVIKMQMENALTWAQSIKAARDFGEESRAVIYEKYQTALDGYISPELAQVRSRFEKGELTEVEFKDKADKEVADYRAMGDHSLAITYNALAVNPQMRQALNPEGLKDQALLTHLRESGFGKKITPEGVERLDELVRITPDKQTPAQMKETAALTARAAYTVMQTDNEFWHTRAQGLGKVQEIDKQIAAMRSETGQILGADKGKYQELQAQRQTLMEGERVAYQDAMEKGLVGKGFDVKTSKGVAEVMANPDILKSKLEIKGLESRIAQSRKMIAEGNSESIIRMSLQSDLARYETAQSNLKSQTLEAVQNNPNIPEDKKALAKAFAAQVPEGDKTFFDTSTLVNTKTNLSSFDTYGTAYQASLVKVQEQWISAGKISETTILTAEQLKNMQSEADLLATKEVYTQQEMQKYYAEEAANTPIGIQKTHMAGGETPLSSFQSDRKAAEATIKSRVEDRLRLKEAEKIVHDKLASGELAFASASPSAIILADSQAAQRQAWVDAEKTKLDTIYAESHKEDSTLAEAAARVRAEANKKEVVANQKARYQTALETLKSDPTNVGALQDIKNHHLRVAEEKLIKENQGTDAVTGIDNNALAHNEKGDALFAQAEAQANIATANIQYAQSRIGGTQAAKPVVSTNLVGTLHDNAVAQNLAAANVANGNLSPRELAEREAREKADAAVAGVKDQVVAQDAGEKKSETAQAGTGSVDAAKNAATAAAKPATEAGASAAEAVEKPAAEKVAAATPAQEPDKEVALGNV